MPALLQRHGVQPLAALGDPEGAVRLAARQAGYANGSGAYKAFWKAVEHNEAKAVEDHRALESAPLDALQVPLWEKAMTGDVKAAGMVLICHLAASRA